MEKSSEGEISWCYCWQAEEEQYFLSQTELWSWCPGRQIHHQVNTDIWLVDTRLYWSLIGWHNTILISDWSTESNNDLWSLLIGSSWRAWRTPTSRPTSPSMTATPLLWPGPATSSGSWTTSRLIMSLNNLNIISPCFANILFLVSLTRFFIEMHHFTVARNWLQRWTGSGMRRTRLRMKKLKMIKRKVIMRLLTPDQDAVNLSMERCLIMSYFSFSWWLVVVKLYSPLIWLVETILLISDWSYLLISFFSCQVKLMTLIRRY